MLILFTIVMLVIIFSGAHYISKYYEHKRKLRMQRHHVEWVLTELDRRRKDNDA